MVVNIFKTIKKKFKTHDIYKIRKRLPNTKSKIPVNLQRSVLNLRHETALDGAAWSRREGGERRL